MTSGSKKTGSPMIDFNQLYEKVSKKPSDSKKITIVKPKKNQDMFNKSKK